LVLSNDEDRACVWIAATDQSGQTPEDPRAAERQAIRGVSLRTGSELVDEKRCDESRQDSEAPCSMDTALPQTPRRTVTRQSEPQQTPRACPDGSIDDDAHDDAGRLVPIGAKLGARFSKDPGQVLGRWTRRAITVQFVESHENVVRRAGL
jgi:hypothetical protein